MSYSSNTAQTPDTAIVHANAVIASLKKANSLSPDNLIRVLNATKNPSLVAQNPDYWTAYHSTITTYIVAITPSVMPKRRNLPMLHIKRPVLRQRNRCLFTFASIIEASEMRSINRLPKRGPALFSRRR
jgi:hypothetical protein